MSEAHKSVRPNDPDQAIEDAEEKGDIETIVGIINFTTEEAAAAATTTAGDDEDNHEWTEATEAALDAFYRMVKSGILVTEVATTTTTYCVYFDSIFLALDAWQHEEAIAEVGLGCIVALCNDMKKKEDDVDGTSTSLDELTERINKVDIVALIVTKIMPLFATEGTIQEQACLALEGLVTAPYGKMNRELQATFQYHIDNGLLQEQLLLARDERITNERNKSYPGRVATALDISI